jgi:N-formylglutamate deformylase
MEQTARFTIEARTPVICTAIHAGNFLSPDCAANMAISAEIKLREEDPFTDILAQLCSNNIIANYSRFEFDLNRKRESSFYLAPEDAWGLKVRVNEPNLQHIETSYQKYDDFYLELYKHLSQLKNSYKKFFIYDIHSYNHRRNGPETAPDDQQNNPDIVLATGNMSTIWDGLIDKLQSHFQQYEIDGRSLDVRKNVKFEGGWFSRWLHYTFPGSVCCLSIEFKKIFMDEWTGELYAEKFNVIKEALSLSFPIIEDHLAAL